MSDRMRESKRCMGGWDKSFQRPRIRRSLLKMLGENFFWRSFYCLINNLSREKLKTVYLKEMCDIDRERESYMRDVRVCLKCLRNKR